MKQSSDGIKTYMKHEDVRDIDGNRWYSFRVEGLVESPNSFFPLCAMLYEVDLYKMWVPSFFGLGLGRASLLDKVFKKKKRIYFRCF